MNLFGIQIGKELPPIEKGFFEQEGLSPDDCQSLDKAIPRIAFFDAEIEPLFKAIVQTPRLPNGKVNYDAVPVGDSIFVRITKPGHAMEGRVILLTKRPDKQMVMGGGAGSQYFQRKARAIRHLPFHTHEAQKEQLSKRRHKPTAEEERSMEERKKLLEHRHKLESHAREQLAQQKGKFIEAMGLGTGEMDEKKAESIGEQAMEHATKAGIEKEKAKKYSNLVKKEAIRLEKKVKEQIAKERAIASHHEVTKTKPKAKEKVADKTGIKVDLPDIEAVKAAKTDVELESIVKNQLHNSLQDALDARTKGGFEKVSNDSLTLADDVEKDNKKLVDHNKRHEAFKEFVGYQKSYEQLVKKYQKLPKVERINPARLEAMRLEAEHLTDEEFESVLQDHQELTTQIEDGTFYRMLGRHWNRRHVDKKLVDSMHSAAATAVNGLVGSNLNKLVEAERVIKALGIEAGTMVLAYHLKDELSPEKYRELVNNVEKRNIQTQISTEQRAIDEAKEYEAQERQIRRQKSTGELANKVMIKRLLLQNLSRQREILGTALGSLEASASTLYSLKTAFHSKNPTIQVSMGNDNRMLRQRMRMLKLRTRGRRKNAEVTYDRVKGFAVKAPVSAFKRYLTETMLDVQNVKELDKIKSDRSGTSRFKVPYFKNRFKDEAGKDRKLNLRTAQRNNLKLFKHSEGVRVITDSTGEGKTLMGLGFMAQQLQKKSRYRGLIVVPAGQSDQWLDKVKRFTHMRVTVIPEKSNQADRKKLYDDAVKTRGLIVTTHKHASIDNEIIAKKKFHGVIIDEPQQLKSQRSANLSAGGKRILSLPIKDRLAMTATPAQDNVLQLYELVNWANPGKLGYRTSFERQFGAYGQGINTQDENVKKLMMQSISPYITSGAAQKRGYNVHYDDHDVKRTREQRTEQGQIEKHAHAIIENAAKDLQQVKGETDGHFRKRRKAARAKAANEVMTMHEDNLKGREDNPMLGKLMENINSAAASQKHAIYVRTKKQKHAVMKALQKNGASKESIADMTEVHKSHLDIDAEKTRFNEDKATKYVMLDDTSAQGFDLQGGHHMHVYGTPEDAGRYTQLVGRLDRPNRKGDFAVHNYKYTDSPHDFQRWNYIQQTKPFVEIVKPMKKAIMYFEIGSSKINGTIRSDTHEGSS